MGGVIAWRRGVSYRLLSENGAAVVTWLRDGHLCVVSGRGVPSSTLRLLSAHDRRPGDGEQDRNRAGAREGSRRSGVYRQR